MQMNEVNNNSRGRVYEMLATAFYDYESPLGTLDVRGICIASGVTYENLTKCIRQKRLTWKVATSLRALEMYETGENEVLSHEKCGELLP